MGNSFSNKRETESKAYINQTQTYRQYEADKACREQERREQERREKERREKERLEILQTQLRYGIIYNQERTSGRTTVIKTERQNEQIFNLRGPWEYPRLQANNKVGNEYKLDAQENRLQEIFNNLSISDIRDVIPTKRIVPNPNLIKTFLSCVDVGSYGMNIESEPYKLESLEPYDPEYQRINRLFNKTNKKCFTVTQIDKITNPCLLVQYNLKIIQSKEKCRNTVENELFHGTKMNNIDSICKRNFDWRLKGTSRGHKFGQGVSFTPISNYATHYGDKTYNKVMFLAKVLLGNVCLGSSNTIIPPNDYDTTTNETGHVYVKYEDNSFYPAYIIYYEGFDVTQHKGRKRVT